VAVKPGVDFSRIRSIALADQDRPELRAVTDELARQLISRGYSVRLARGRAAADADALLQVSVAQYTPDKKYLVQLDKDSGGRARDVFVLNPAMEVGGRSVYPTTGVSGVEGAQIVVSNATVSLSARLLDARTKEILWSTAVTYEGLDLDAAVEGAAASLMKRFPASR
jgi:hypothetical protein